MKIDNLSPKELAAYFDHSILHAYNVLADYDKHIDECLEYGFCSAAVNSHIVPHYVKRLAGSGVLVGAAIGFPLGQASVAGKLAEARAAIKAGAGELDYVLNISRLLDGDRAYVKDEMVRMVDLSHSKGVVLKVIIETCYLQEMHKMMACEIALESGIDFVKTSTGFGTAGANVEDLKLMRNVLGDQVKIKAAGYMKTLENVAAAIETGADRIGSAFGPSILDAFVASRMS